MAQVFSPALIIISHVEEALPVFRERRFSGHRTGLAGLALEVEDFGVAIYHAVSSDEAGLSLSSTANKPLG